VARNRKRARDRRAPRAGDPARPGVATAGEELEDPVAEAAPVELADEAVDSPPVQLAADESEPELDDRGGGSSGGGRGLSTGGGDSSGDSEERHAPLPAVRESLPSRMVNFVQGSWRELQRVQWPDRRQVMQATGVVLGFVIVAGAYLGLADGLAGKIVNFILK
jgi:preprotein translocase SecE subunit